MSGLKNLAVLSVFLYATLVNANAGAENPRIETKAGTIFGKVVQFSHADTDIKRPVHVFKGIPYAEPPVGELRFQPTIPKTSWEGDYNAKFQRPACPQKEMPLLPLNETIDEDCLHLNVYVPIPVPDNAAVMVWIHGGAFYIGSGADTYYDGIPFVAINDVILVTINYRLGALGFLSTGDSVIPGNFGMLDQIEALKWVQNNIAEFGGDPKKVTIFGESAGAMGVSFLVLSPLSEGLFQRGIMQSGTALAEAEFQSDKKRVNELAHGLGKLLNCEKETSEELLECLRSTPMEDFLEPQDPETGMLANVTETIVILPFSPFVDGNFLPDMPLKLLQEKRINKIDSMLGMTADELTLIMPVVDPEAFEKTSISLNRSTFEEALSTAPVYFGSKLNDHPQILEAAKIIYLDWDHVDDPNTDYFDPFVQIFSDELVVCPTDLFARGLAEAGLQTYYYSMSHIPAKSIFKVEWAKAAHAEDLAFVFGSHFREKGDWIMPQEDLDVSLQMMKYWTNFAKTGNPNLSSENAELTSEEKSVEWPAFTVPEMYYKDISTSMQTKRALKARECAFWNKYVPGLVEALDASTSSCGAEDSEHKYSKETNEP
ncbi:fatty acyl-CoA hydrolase precursor, medium chain-like [Glandiceps talaboti]